MLSSTATVQAIAPSLPRRAVQAPASADKKRKLKSVHRYTNEHVSIITYLAEILWHSTAATIMSVEPDAHPRSCWTFPNAFFLGPTYAENYVQNTSIRLNVAVNLISNVGWCWCLVPGLKALSEFSREWPSGQRRYDWLHTLLHGQPSAYYPTCPSLLYQGMGEGRCIVYVTRSHSLQPPNDKNNHRITKDTITVF